MKKLSSNIAIGFCNHWLDVSNHFLIRKCSFISQYLFLCSLIYVSHSIYFLPLPMNISYYIMVSKHCFKFFSTPKCNKNDNNTEKLLPEVIIFSENKMFILFLICSPCYYICSKWLIVYQKVRCLNIGENNGFTSILWRKIPQHRQNSWNEEKGSPWDFRAQKNIV